MSGGVGGIGLNQTNTPQPVETQQAHAQPLTVQSHGQTVQTQPASSSLVADAQEEAGMLLQDKSADKLNKRDARSRSASRVREIMKKYLKQVAGVNQTEKFEKMAATLKNMGKATPDEIRGLLEQFKRESDDENFESALLLALEELLAAEGTHEDLLEAVREVKTELGNELQEFYQSQVKNYEDVSEVYEQLLGEYGEEDFLSATESLISRLGDDINAQKSSVENNKVKATVDSLYHLQVARNTYAAFAGLMEKMQAVFDVNGA